MVVGAVVVALVVALVVAGAVVVGVVDALVVAGAVVVVVVVALVVVGVVVGGVVVGALVVVVAGCILFVNTNGWLAVNDVHTLPIPGINTGSPVRNWLALASIHTEVEPLLVGIIIEFLFTIPPPLAPIVPAL